VVKVACDEIDQRNSGAHSGETKRDLGGSWENIEVTEIPLTQQEQAVIHLYKLWDVEYLKKNDIHAHFFIYIPGYRVGTNKTDNNGIKALL
jgi:hypothetical protein